MRGVPRSPLVRATATPSCPECPRTGPGVCRTPRDTLARVHSQRGSCRSVPCPPAEHRLDAKSVSQAEFGSILPGARSCPEGEIRLVPGEQAGGAALRAMPRRVLPSSRGGCGQEGLRPALQVLASLEASQWGRRFGRWRLGSRAGGQSSAAQWTHPETARQASTQRLPAAQSSLQAVTFHRSLRQQARESHNILPIPKGGVWGARKNSKVALLR